MAQSVGKANAAAEFVLHRTFEASREDVWNAFTQPEHLRHWLGPQNCSIEITRHELKPGGLFHYCMKYPNGRAVWMRSVFREILPPERLVSLNSFSDERGALARSPWLPKYPVQTVNTLMLAEEDGRTLLTLRVVPLDASDEEAGVFTGALAGMTNGIGASFDVLADYLAHRT